MKIGIDYSFARPDPAAIKQRGYGFVCRYLSSYPAKNISLAEAKALRAKGLEIVLVWENSQDDALRGEAGGIADAQIAQKQAKALGFPTNRPIYFAVDFDATPAQQAAIDAYLNGARRVLGHDHVGVYGGYWVILRCAQNRSASFFWQTLAWSGGNIYPHVHIYQNGRSDFAGGADIDEARQSFYGQWDLPTPPAPSPAPVPKPTPAPIPTPHPVPVPPAPTPTPVPAPSPQPMPQPTPAPQPKPQNSLQQLLNWFIKVLWRSWH